MMNSPPPHRVIALGASNLTRGFHLFVATARARWGDSVEIVTAQGLGRSFGGPSKVFVRSLPGILQCGLWGQLRAMPPAPTNALITDIGNDILFGYSPAQVVAWVEDCVGRLERHTNDITVVGLPIANIRKLTPARFVFYRTILFPFSRMSLEQAVGFSQEVENGIEKITAEHGLRFVQPKPEWYARDPIHIRPIRWSAAWRRYLNCATGDPKGHSSFAEAIQLYLMPPEYRRVFGHEQFTPQRGVKLRDGAIIWQF